MSRKQSDGAWDICTLDMSSFIDSSTNDFILGVHGFVDPECASSSFTTYEASSFRVTSNSSCALPFLKNILERSRFRLSLRYELSLGSFCVTRAQEAPNILRSGDSLPIVTMSLRVLRPSNPQAAFRSRRNFPQNPNSLRHGLRHCLHFQKPSLFIAAQCS